MMIRYGVYPHVLAILIGFPILTIVASSLVFGLSLWFSALNVSFLVM